MAVAKQYTLTFIPSPQPREEHVFFADDRDVRVVLWRLCRKVFRDQASGESNNLRIDFDDKLEPFIVHTVSQQSEALLCVR